MTVTTSKASKIVTAEQLNKCNRVEDVATGSIFYMIESQTTPSQEYKVEAIQRHGHYYVTCTCPAGLNGRDCWHKAAAAAHAAEYKEMVKAAARAQAQKDAQKPLVAVAPIRDIESTLPAFLLTGRVASHMKNAPKEDRQPRKRY
jgi:hypothetical protein